MADTPASLELCCVAKLRNQGANAAEIKLLPAHLAILANGCFEVEPCIPGVRCLGLHVWRVQVLRLIEDAELGGHVGGLCMSTADVLPLVCFVCARLSERAHVRAQVSSD